MSLKKRGIAVGVLCYVIWGILPAYWNLLLGVNPLLILCGRVVFALVFMLCVLAVTGRMHVFFSTLKDRKKMRYLIPSAVLITFNWGLYIWAVNSGHIIEASLGYYMNPLISFLLGVIIFSEKYTKLQLLAVGLALAGVLVSIIAFGSVPIIAISLATTFATYGALKKKAHADPNSSIAIESLIAAPFALVLAFVFMTESIAAVNFTQMLLLIGGGAATAIPLVLYARAVNSIPYITIGFLQYISPTLAIIYGVMIGTRPSDAQIVSFIFIGLGLIVFSIALRRIAKKEAG